MYYAVWLAIKGRIYKQRPSPGFHLSPSEVLSTHEYLSRESQRLWYSPIFGAILGAVKICLMLILTLQAAAFFREQLDPLFMHFNRSKLVRLANRVDRLACLQPIPVHTKRFRDSNTQQRRYRNRRFRKARTIPARGANSSWNRLSQM